MATLGTTVISTVTLVTDTLQDNQAGVTSWSLARVDTVTEAACTDYTCAVKIIPAWVGILILGSWLMALSQ